MKRITSIARITGIVIAAIATALFATVLCALEEDRSEMLAMLEEVNKEEGARCIDWEDLPPEVIAWVKVPGTSIDEPIVQATSDEPNVYLYKDALGRGAYGTPYIDSECSLDSPFVMVYGHHMSDGTVFAEFANFIDEGFAREHSRIIVYKRNGETSELETCAVDVVNASQERLVIDQEGDLEESIGSADLQLSSPSKVEQLFAFTTCSYQTWNSRTTVYAAVPNT